jgi:hypothetical protein
MKRWFLRLYFLIFVGSLNAQSLSSNMVFYAGNGGKERFNDVHLLSDGTALIAGQAADLAWLPANTPRIAIPVTGVDSAATGSVAFILHVSADFSQILRVIEFPANTVRDVFKIRSSEVPGSATGTLFISGSRDSGSTDGYYLAKLNANFVSGIPSALSYVANIGAAGDHKDRQPWDVGGDGKVVYALGRPFDTQWAAIQKLGVNGVPEVVENWTAHWQASGAEWDGTPASSFSGATLAYSAVVMKNSRRGSLRSVTAADFALLGTDANGNTGRKGKMPDDYYFNSHCELAGTNTCPNTGPGYTNYNSQGPQTQRVGGIAVDRRNNNVYFGYGTKSTLPGGNPDFEPAVVAMNANGSLLWWDRLYQETTANSSPDQYIDGIAIDYTNSRLVLLGRSHGNNTINLWRGDQLLATPGASGFQNQFSGTSGNIHISWLGSYSLSDGKIRASTYVAEYVDGSTNFGAAFSDSHYAGWPNPNLGWPDLNTTRCGSDAGQSGEIAIDTLGNVAVTCIGRRSFTTADAYQAMPRPNQTPRPSSAWNSFVRVYSPDLSRVQYSSLVVGQWDQLTGAGGDNTRFSGVALAGGYVLAVGMQIADANGVAVGANVTTTGVPTWGQANPSSQSALLVRLTGSRLSNANSNTIFYSGFEN